MGFDIRRAVAVNLTRLMAAVPHLSTQEKLAARTGLGAGTIGRVRKAEVAATVDTLDAIARAFHIKVRDLVDGAGKDVEHSLATDSLAGRIADLPEPKRKAIEQLLDAFEESSTTK
jgi:transcriptional regulator with XRE-family HTH domain